MAAKKKATKKEKAKEPEMVVTEETGVSEISETFLDEMIDEGPEEYKPLFDEMADQGADSEGVAEKVKVPEIELVQELIRYEFTDSELVALATEISEMMQRLDRLTAEKKSAASAYDSDLKKLALDMQEIGQGIRDRFEMRRMGCYVLKDFKKKKAYYFRSDQYELDILQMVDDASAFAEDRIDSEYSHFHPPVKIRDLKGWELQKQFDFEKEAAGGDGDPQQGDGDPGAVADADFENPGDDEQTAETV